MLERKNANQVSGYLDEWTFSQCKAYAEAHDRSISWVVGFAMKQFFVGENAKVPLSGDGKRTVARLRQVDITEAIADAVKRSTVKPAKHK